MEDFEIEMLRILEENARISCEELAETLGVSVETVKESLRKLEENGVILKYKAIVNWEKLQEDYVYAVINVKVSLSREKGYDDIAR
ncbi:MAG: Lrp/AsnC family transcriptional regulator, partial [Archaeoglobaceae archaeon]